MLAPGATLVFYTDGLIESRSAHLDDGLARLLAAAERAAGTSDPDALCDVMIKRFHEYKRQLLKVLHVVTLVNRVRNGTGVLPRSVVFAGKGAPGYHAVKRIIRLVNAVADTVNPPGRGTGTDRRHHRSNGRRPGPGRGRPPK